MACCKKEHAHWKKKGNMDERESNTICCTLFKLLLYWEGNVFVWCFIWWLASSMLTVLPCTVLKGGYRTPSHSSLMRWKWARLVSLFKKKCYANPHDPFHCILVPLDVFESQRWSTEENREAFYLPRIPVQDCCPNICKSYPWDGSSPCQHYQ